MNMKSLIISIFIVLCFFDLKADWLSFRGSHVNGSTELKSPSKPILKSKDSWQKDLPGRGLSSPVVIDDRIFITASSGPNQENLHIIGFSEKDGKKLWEKKFKATGRTICHEKTSVAASTISSDGKKLVAQFSSNDVFCLNLDGKLLWLRGLAFDHPNLANGLGMSSSPVISKGIAVIQVENDADSYSFGLDLVDGSTIWKNERPRAANWTSPILIQRNEIELVGLQSKEGLEAIEPGTGQTIWSYKDGASTIPSSAWNGSDVLIIPSHGITALRLDTSLQEFNQIWRENKLKPGTGSPSIKDGNLYVVNNANVLSCASVETGEIKWRLRLKGPVSSSPVLGPDHLYVFSETGLGQVIDLKQSTPEVTHTIDLEDTILSTPALSKKSLFIRSDKRLYKLSN